MEWLTHSQKKYCELCKTSFRFTKLYDPGMPTRIPTSVFIRRAAIHVLKLFITWCRAVLVASVWLVLLPWCMRVVWRSLFWVGDGGWTHDDFLDAGGNRSQVSVPSPFDLDAVQSARRAAEASNTSIPLPLPSLMMPFSQTLNMSSNDSTIWSLVKRLFFFRSSYLFPTTSPVPEANSTFTNTTVDYLGPRSPSLLSDVTFFNWFPSQAANRFVVDVLEGQLITLFVVVAFILIFLIREWVVQQQPVINMVALGDDAEAQQDHEHEDPHEHEDEDENEDHGGEEEDTTQQDVPESAREATSIDDQEISVTNAEDDTHSVVRARRSSSAVRRDLAVVKLWQDSEGISEELRRAMNNATDLARIIEQMPLEDSVKLKEAFVKLSGQLSSSSVVSVDEFGNIHPVETEAEESSARGRTFSKRSSSTALNDEITRGGSPSASQRPPLPSRHRSSIATEIRRGLEEGNSWSFNNVPQASEEDTDQAAKNSVPDSWYDQDVGPVTGSGSVDQSTEDQEHGSDQSSESWQQIPDNAVSSTGQESSADKGKAKAPEEDSKNSHGIVFTHPESDADNFEGPSESNNIASIDSGPASSSHREETGINHQQVSQGTGPEPSSNEAQGLEQNPTPIVQPPPRLLDRILDWVFGDIAPDVQAAEDVVNDEHIVQDLADEAPFVPANEPREPADLNDQDPEVAAAAAEAGIDVNDQDAIDDAEDLEGIMELIGMQGPLTGLFQNAMFSAVLISATLACAVWLPYLWGKLVILIMGSPISVFVKLPVQTVAIIADLVVDGALCIAAGGVYLILKAMVVLVKFGTLGMLNRLAERPIGLIAGPAHSIAISAADRLKSLVLVSPVMPTPAYFRLSVNAHVALRAIQNTTSHTLNQTSAMVASLYEDAATESTTEVVSQLLRQAPTTLRIASTALYNKSVGFLSWILTTKSYKITLDLDFGRNVNAAYVALEQWTAADRLIAVLAGYAFFALLGAAYLRRGVPLTSSQQGQKVERVVADILQQAGGVLKVILIISIEMLVFPLYCGLLLNMALLPLFKDASLYSRWQFTRESPWTSGFVHWFLGTCYMFHFALFVSMCRKILRRGVLYFIRDPDDPTFHPVRDVLERSVTTQLRKIAFSGLVYGGLVIICLGGVVWSLNTVTVGVLPIHWVSHAPSLEFPLDLLFYNFLTPVIIRVYKPSDGLHAISQWWFKCCARSLRLSNFLFGDKKPEEEGREVDGEFVVEGKYVRAPASDQVRIPKGERVFIEVDSSNNRKDGKPEEGGVHNSDLVTMVHIPPWFRLRIATFVVTIWIFAAIMGICLTIIPLIVGRYLFSLFLPTRIEMNDIHAFSLGVYTLGSIVYTIFQVYKFFRSINRPVSSPLTALYTVVATTSRVSLRALRFAYVWTGLILLVPFLFAVLIELYLLMPLHAYLGPSEPHVVHLIQDWTLGFLYARLAARIIFSDRTNRPARAFSAVVQNGYLYPNAKIATRCFLLPTIALFSIAIVVPSIFAISMNKTLYMAADATTKSQVWRFSYPAVGLSIIAFWAAKEGISVARRWRMVVRDEVYLIGERLHNFGDRRAVAASSSSTQIPLSE
jgi:E3 ubiquitin-protein ligase MARCH6